MSVPPFKIGDRVKIEPIEDAPARVIGMYLAEDGWTVEVRYFHNGEPKTIKCFPDEVRA